MSRPGPPLSGQLLRFAGVGVIGTLSYLLLYVVLRGWLSPAVASAVGRVAVAVPSTWLNGRVTFRRRVSARRLHLGTVALLAVGTVTTWLALAGETHLVTRTDRLVEVLTVAAATVVAAALRFLLLRAWVFRTGRPPARPAAAAAPP